MSYEDASRAADPPRQASTQTHNFAAVSATNALFARWQQHQDRHARELLVTQYLPLARKLASRYLGANEPVDDLIQVANLALLKAINRFDPSRGVAFSSFAVPTILGELRRHFRDNGWAVHVPRDTKEAALRVQNATQQLIDQNGQVPSALQVAQYLEWDVSTVLTALEAGAAHHAKSLDVPVGGDEDDGGSLGDTIGSEDERYEQVEARLTAAAAMRVLTPRERDIVTLRFNENLSQQEIGNRVGVSQMQVSRLLRSALDRLRETAR